MLTSAVAGIFAIVWAYMLCARGRFWMCGVRDAGSSLPPAEWPSVAVVVPARNEAEVIGKSVESMLRQSYQGPLAVIVVDDDSTDGTASLAQEAAQRAGTREVTVVSSQGLPAGWTGKLWALKRGIAVAEQRFRPDYLLLTDADIVHAPDSVAWLVAHASAGGYVLTSLMAKLHCKSWAERTLIPAFVYFFQMLYPPNWIMNRKAKTAGAAGGCVLLRAGALRDAGGIDSIRNALIDDCALAGRLKSVGPIWLGLTERVHSIRPYPDIADIKHMVSRTAYAQLHYSPWLLIGTTIGMLLIFVAPPLLALFADGVPRLLGVATWVGMAISMRPILRFYGLSSLWALALPAIAFFYTWFTLDSAYQHARRRGGQWKGRVHANAPSL
jgi:hopene-associated glycosyltransferase HpnB